MLLKKKILGWLVGAFSVFEMLDTGNPVQNWRYFWKLRQIRNRRGWYNTAGVGGFYVFD